MKNIGLIVGVAILSSILSVTAYKFLEEPQQVIIRESAPVVYTNYADEEPPSNQDKTIPTQRHATTLNFIGAAERVTPAVVNIKAVENRSVGFWKGGAYSSSSGSGVLISPEGYIITNNHVIEDGNEYEITLNDKREYKAELVGVDESTDLAVLRIKDKDNLPFVRFGNSDALRVGEWVLAVGNPFNLESTVTAGIVSAKGRNIDILEDQYSIESFIQTDAAVNPGNSGGALVNSNGELIGINTAIITQSGRYEGYSFAIPTNIVQKVIRDIKDFGIVQRGILGVGIDPVDANIAEQLGLEDIKGVHVKSVELGSGADDAGLLEGDVLTSINGVKTNSMPQLQEQVARFRPGNKLKVEYIRKGKTFLTEVILKNKSNSTSLITKDVDDYEMLNELGFELRELTRDEQKNLQQDGVIVKSVFRNSKIERTNMDPGFIITKINDVKVTDVTSVITEINKAESNDKIMLEGIYENYQGEYYYAFSVE